jgi:UDP-glucose 4-epimerase
VQGVSTPYARTKLICEHILEDLHKSPKGKGWNVVLLRYFCPVGAHER